MKRELVLATTGLALAVSACASGPMNNGPPRPREVRLAYSCDNGEQVGFRYFPDQGIGVLERGGQNVELNRVQAPRGKTFSNGQTTVAMGADHTRMTMSVGMMAPTQCRGQIVPPNRPIAPPPVRPGQPIPPPPPMQPPAPAEMRISYMCDNGEKLTVRYFPQQGVASLARGGQNIELNQSRTPPGFTYSNGQTTLRVAEDRMTMQMTVGMMASTSCMAR